jgi:creatinine amidohydrolase
VQLGPDPHRRRVLGDAPLIARYPFDHAAKGETSLMMELCPEGVDMERLSTDKWYLETAREASKELGAEGARLVLSV